MEGEDAGNWETCINELLIRSILFLQKLIMVAAATSISCHPTAHASSPPSPIAIAASSACSRSYRKAMGLEFIDLQPRPLPPINTPRADVGERQPRLRKEGKEEEAEICVTPNPEAANPALAPPRKPRSSKRKLAAPPGGYFPVPSDLAALFVPATAPASRRIRT